MATGLLQLTGTIQLQQFWPGGESDADTIVVDVASSGAFAFRPQRDAAFQPTDVFYGAKVRGKSGSKLAVDKNRVHIRLQGVDAPELHYLAHLLKKKSEMSDEQLQLCKKWNKCYRQPFGESAAAALGQELNNSGHPVLPCQVTTAVDHPNQVFDTYARMIGDVVVDLHGQRTDINHWLVENGWAYPAFYTSMSKSEIESLVRAAKRAKNRLLWKHYARVVGQLDTALLERRSSTHPAIVPDAGAVLFPKLFRRLVEWTVNHKAKLLPAAFHAWLLTKDDKCYRTTDFLVSELTSSSLAQHQFAEFVKGKQVLFSPEDLVFSEADSTVVGADGKPILDWGVPHVRAAAAL